MTNRHMHEIILRRRQPVALRPEATVQEASLEMRNHRIGAVLVTDEEGRLLGIFTGRDALCRMLAECRDPARTTLAEVMTKGPEVIGPQVTAIEALRLMRDCGFRHLPVVDGDRLLGIVSRGDFEGLEQARLDEETGLWERL
jgi:CBS domain-containing protein